MVEIKSTLDLIMERTKNWTMTDEEKAQLKQQEIESKIKGLVQRMIDGLISIERAAMEFASLKERGLQSAVPALKKELLQRLHLEMNHDMMVSLIRTCINPETESLLKIIEHFQKQTRNEMELRAGELKTQFEKKGINGSAVIPNLEADEQWKSKRFSLENAFKTRVAEYLEIE